ncbi:hypothetical protein [Paenirhodobacter sp.]|uniref:hypothetical protein n=1 Tax=Paenirhodobacter sp. TaxID=1965326 RepID=UPI003B50AA48
MSDRPDPAFSDYMAAYRHYSLLRFSILPIYLSFSLAMHAGFYVLATGAAHPPQLWLAGALLPVAGMIATLVFMGLEYRLDAYIGRFRALCEEIERRGRLADANMPRGFGSISTLAQVLYALGLVCFFIELVLITGLIG